MNTNKASLTSYILNFTFVFYVLFIVSHICLMENISLRLCSHCIKAGHLKWFLLICFINSVYLWLKSTTFFGELPEAIQSQQD